MEIYSFIKYNDLLVKYSDDIIIDYNSNNQYLDNCNFNIYNSFFDKYYDYNINERKKKEYFCEFFNSNFLEKEFILKKIEYRQNYIIREFMKKRNLNLKKIIK